MNDLLRTALEYERHRFSVVPLHTPTQDGGCSCGQPDCDTPGKHPRLTSWKEYQRRRATGQEIERWWTQWPDANIGIITGAVSRLVVVDIDGQQGKESLRGNRFPKTPVVTTGRGLHVYLRHPGFECRNASDKWPDGNTYPGLDFRGDGGLVVAPPSLHVTGKQYAFCEGRSLNDVRLAPLPEWFATMLRNGPGKPATGGEAAEVGCTIPVGRRNATLTSLAGTMRRVGFTQAAIEAALKTENAARCDPPLSEGEVSGIAASVGKYEPEAGQEAGAIPLISLSNLLAEDVQPPRWRADRLIPEVGLAMLAGDSGVGKSWLVYHLALCVSAGVPFLGHFPTEQGPALVVDLEAGRVRTQRRFRKLLAGMDSDGDSPPVSFAFGPALRLDKAESAERFAAFIKDAGAAMVIVDSLRRVHSGDENTSETANQVGGYFRSLAEEAGCAVVLVHHLRKESAFAPNKGGERVRGSSDWRAVLDSLLVLSKKRRGILAVEHAKSRDCEELPEFLIEADFGEGEAAARLRYIGQVEKAEKCEVVQDSIIKRLAASGGAWRKDLLAMAEELGVSQVTVRRALDGLQARGVTLEQRVPGHGKPTFCRLADPNLWGDEGA